MRTDVTQGRLNKMCKYFKNKRVSISYAYNNSLGHHYVTKTIGTYNSFKIEIVCDYAEVRFYKDEKILFTFGIDCLACAEFVGFGKIDILNSGPYCYFRIRRKSWWQIVN